MALAPVMAATTLKGQEVYSIVVDFIRQRPDLALVLLGMACFNIRDKGAHRADPRRPGQRCSPGDTAVLEANSITCSRTPAASC